MPEVSLVGYGKSINIFKQTGNPKDVVKKFKLSSFSGTHMELVIQEWLLKAQ